MRASLLAGTWVALRNFFPGSGVEVGSVGLMILQLALADLASRDMTIKNVASPVTAAIMPPTRIQTVVCIAYVLRFGLRPRPIFSLTCASGRPSKRACKIVPSGLPP